MPPAELVTASPIDVHAHVFMGNNYAGF